MVDFARALSGAISPRSRRVSEKLEYPEKAEIEENLLCPIRIFEINFWSLNETNLLTENGRTKICVATPLRGSSRFAHYIFLNLKFSNFGYRTAKLTDRFWYNWFIFAKFGFVNSNSGDSDTLVFELETCSREDWRAPNRREMIPGTLETRGIMQTFTVDNVNRKYEFLLTENRFGRFSSPLVSTTKCMMFPTLLLIIFITTARYDLLLARIRGLC